MFASVGTTGHKRATLNQVHMDPLNILKKQFGYPAFRFHQEAIIACVLAKKDTFVLMPTGAGKSICYQIPALMLDGLAIVVSPLIALMKDQVDALRTNGIHAAYINSTQTWQEQEEILRDAREVMIGCLVSYQLFLFFSPTLYWVDSDVCPVLKSIARCRRHAFG